MKHRKLKAALLILALVIAARAWAGARGETISILEGIEQTDSLGLEAWLETNTPFQIEVGEEVGFRFRSAADVYLTTLYIDASGAVVVLHSGDDLLPADTELAFPPKGAGQQMIAQPPLGSESVFAIATTEPLPQALFLDEKGSRTDAFESPEDGRLFAKRLAAFLRERGTAVDVASFSHEIVAAGAPRRFTATKIVDHFTTRTRSLTRPKLDLDIQFQFGSAELTEQAKRDLDELGKALEHPAMKSRRFELAGHTDDVGEANYNMILSRQRAESARKYLLSHYEVVPENVHSAGYGEEQPLMPGTSEAARQRNRRVEIEQMP